MRFFLASGRFDIPDWFGIFLYLTGVYLAPVAFVVGIIGSIVFAIRSRWGGNLNIANVK